MENVGINMGYTINAFTKEYQRKHMPNIRTIGGIYWDNTQYEADSSFIGFDHWQDWNCNRCKHDILTNSKETLHRLKHKLPLKLCWVQGELILNLFERHRIPDEIYPLLGMNRYGIGTCALFEELENNGN